MNPTNIELLATIMFGLAVLHTFCVKRFAHWGHKYPPGSLMENIFHFLAETEVVFGLWAAALFAGIAAVKGSVHDAVAYVEGLNYTEPKFVLAVMVVIRSTAEVDLAVEFAGTAVMLFIGAIRREKLVPRPVAYAPPPVPPAAAMPQAAS